MPTNKPRILITLDGPEQHELLKHYARVQGKSVSGLLNELIQGALKPVLLFHKAASSASPEGQADLVEFLEALTEPPLVPSSRLPGAAAAGQASMPRSPPAMAAQGPSRSSKVAKKPPKARLTPGSNTGVTSPRKGSIRPQAPSSRGGRA